MSPTGQADLRAPIAVQDRNRETWLAIPFAKDWQAVALRPASGRLSRNDAARKHPATKMTQRLGSIPPAIYEI